MALWAEDPFYDKYEHGNLNDVAVPEREPQVSPLNASLGERGSSPSRSGTAVRQAMPDHQGLGPAWQRRGCDRDEFTDRIADSHREEDGWRGAPHGEDSYW